MILKQLEIHGFKSFAERTVLDFYSDSKKAKITGIVGPNGSGKSNVVDAIRWVLGEQSYKLMRSKKSEDVVFFGSAKKSKGSAAVVSMILDNSGNEIPVDFSEVVITRKVYGSGESEYLINKSKVRLIDVQELLSKCGFGQTTYTVLGQGMVDQLLFYGPTERKVLFDEAAGVKKYQIKRDQSIKKLEATDQNLIRIKDILSELSPRLKHLKKQVERACERSYIEKEFKDLIQNYYSYNWHILESKVSELSKNKQELDKERGKIESELSEINKKLEGNEEKNFNSSEKIRNKSKILYSERDKLKEEFIILSGNLRIEKEREDIDGGRLEDEMEAKKRIISEIEVKLKNKEKEVLDKNKELANLMKELSKFQTKILEAQSNLRGNDDISTNLLVLKKEYQDLSERQEELIKILENSKDIKDIESAKKKALEISNLIVSFWEKVRNLNKKESHNEAILKVEELSKEKERFLNGISEIRIQISSLEAGISNLNEQKNILEREIERLTERLEKIKENKSSMEKIKNMEADLAKVKNELDRKEEELEKIRNEIQEEEAKERKKETEIYEMRIESREKQRLLDDYNLSTRDIEIEIARVETKKEDLKDEILREIGNMEEIKGNIVSQLDVLQTERKIYSLKQKLASVGGVDEEVEEEYKEIEERHIYLTAQVDDLENAKNDLRKIIKNLDEKIKEQFGDAFSKIGREFKKYFEVLFDGGQAGLSLNYSEECGKEMGIEIQAQPPGKRVKNLSALSGGERTLTSLALLFAILSVNPSPFVVLDEVDAALDEANTKRFLKIIEDLSSKTQFIVVTHNRETMKIASSLYGITMNENHISKILSLELKEAVVN